tara:strand:- start:499 stop:888 length:390 start_codon:yes stop_codon:yes gene_type:complete
MPNKSQYLKAFNDLFILFVSDITTIFPEDDDLLFTLNALKQIRKANPTILIKVFTEYVVKQYGDHIEAKNIDFFIEKDYKSDVQFINNNNTILDKINSLREPIRKMDLVNKNKTIQYLQNLKKICDLYN